MQILRDTWLVLRSAFKKYLQDDPSRLASQIAFYAMFAMAPVLFVIISVLGILMGEKEISSRVYTELNELLGTQGTEYVKGMVNNFQSRDRGVIGTIIGGVIFILASTTFFTIVQKTLNYIWRVKAKPKSNLLRSLLDRLISFGMILLLGAILMVSILIDAVVGIAGDYIREVMPQVWGVLVIFINQILSLGIITVAFAFVFKFLPDVRIKWRVTWIGALITGLLFHGGKELIGFALGQSNIGVLYGAAGSLVLILMWVFYSSFIFLLGAEITQQYALKFDRDIVPKDYAVKIEITEIEEE